MHDASYLVRLFFYVVRYFLYVIYSLLQFISKPGSRYIVPVAIGVLMYLNLSTLQEFSDGFFDQLHWRLSNPGMVERVQHQAMRLYKGYSSEWYEFDGLLVVIFGILSLSYLITSRVLNLLIGTFPPIIKPLPPLRKLRAKTPEVTPAVVKIVVAPLRR